MNISTINFLLALGTMAMQVAILILLILLIFRKQLQNYWGYKFIQKNGLFIAFLVALGASLGSLFYSNIAGFPPCDLCWYQRIFMYPQAIILGLGIWIRDYKIKIYAMVLSVIGALIAAYQVILQFQVSDVLINLADCTTDITQPSCSAIEVLEFGYITLPVMSLIVFILIFLLAYFSKE